MRLEKIDRAVVEVGQEVTVTHGKSTIVGTVHDNTRGVLTLEVSGWKTITGSEFLLDFYAGEDITVEVEVETFTTKFEKMPLYTVAIYAPNGVPSPTSMYMKLKGGVCDLGSPSRPINPVTNSAVLATQFLWLLPEEAE